MEVLGTRELYTVANDPAAFRKCLDNGTPLRREAPHSPALADVDRLAGCLLGAGQRPSSDAGPDVQPGLLGRVFDWFGGR